MLYELDSPLATHLVNTMRDSRIDALRFRQYVKSITVLLADEATRNIPMQPHIVPTWQGKFAFEQFVERQLLFVTVLRAGLPMLEALNDLFLQSQAGFLAIKRDETTHESKLYYDRVPDCKGKHVILVDPMIATGGSLIDALNLLSERGAERIISLNIIASPEGVKRVAAAFPDVDLYVAKIDERLDRDKFIIPGLGDAGDREYNTVERNR